MNNSNICNNYTYSFNTKNKIWSKLSVENESYFKPRRGHTTCYYNKCIYVFGGGDRENTYNDIFQLDLNDQKLSWKKIKYSGSISPRGYHSATLNKNNWIVYGGSDGTKSLDDAYIIDLDTFVIEEIKTKTSVPRMGHTSQIFENKLYIIGGRTQDTYTSDIMCLDIKNGQITKCLCDGLEPPNKAYHCSILYETSIYVFGGYDGETCFDNVYSLNFNTLIH